MIYFFLKLLGIVLGLVASGWLILKFTLINYSIRDKSMEPTLREGDRVLVFRFWPAGWISKNKLVILRPRNGVKRQKISRIGEIQPYIKRIIGLPGDVITLQIEKMDADVLIAISPWLVDGVPGLKKLRVPPRHLFVMGDNAPQSHDSFSFGPVPFSDVLGIVIREFHVEESDKRSCELKASTVVENLIWKKIYDHKNK